MIVELAAAGAVAGEWVAVIGAGQIGMLTGARGARSAPRRRARLTHRAVRGVPSGSVCATVACGDTVAPLATAPPAAVFECAGTAGSAALALELVAPLGRVIVAGIAPEPLPLEPLAVVFKEVDVRGSFITGARTSKGRSTCSPPRRSPVPS